MTTAMIPRLLAILDGGHAAVGTDELARRLDASPAAVEGALELLVRKGRLVRGDPSGACGACPAQAMCNPLAGQTTRYFRVGSGSPGAGPRADGPPCGCSGSHRAGVGESTA